MSAYIVEDKTINSIVTFARNSNIIDMDANELGQKLLDENIDSVDYRYKEENDRLEYKHENIKVEPKQVYKDLKSLMYQSCEQPTWEASQAFIFLSFIETHLINIGAAKRY